ncbi:uncharacterized protein LOC133843288 [Drosophila sulfurigaster albostrigata]|uniref:uncharacterized protein LOC133843288 n=1 Tax=Drosophila sulfurigaster albostrigata TaxID=89887 RepID=UPI002D21A82F|nr:uncharacterized protein LOC133843288 [Drosophila sulfurigaster albostrigata]
MRRSAVEDEFPELNATVLAAETLALGEATTVTEIPMMKCGTSAEGRDPVGECPIAAVGATRIATAPWSPVKGNVFVQDPLTQSHLNPAIQLQLLLLTQLLLQLLIKYLPSKIYNTLI